MWIASVLKKYLKQMEREREIGGRFDPVAGVRSEVVFAQSRFAAR